MMFFVDMPEMIQVHIKTDRLCTFDMYTGPLIIDLSDFQRQNMLPKANNVK